MKILESLTSDDPIQEALQTSLQTRWKVDTGRVQNLCLVVAALVALGASWRLISSQSGTTFVVNSTGDAKDAHPGDGVCASDMGACTLRAALEEVNTHPHFGTDRIQFAIPGEQVHRIQPQTLLPAVKQPLIIDGTSEPGARANSRTSGPLNARLLIELNGASVVPGPGLRFLAGSEGSVVRGLVINDFNAYSGSGVSLLTKNVTVAGCYIGTNAQGTVEQPNRIGVYIGSVMTSTLVDHSTIGGAAPADRNLIVNNAQQGVLISDFASDTRFEANTMTALTPLTPREPRYDTQAKANRSL